MATPNYMKRIAFLDGQILHDFHLNIMQKNISEAIKLKTSMERYDMLMLVSPYNYYFAEPFITNENRHASSTAVIDTLTFSITTDQWITPILELPDYTAEINIQANYEDFPEQNCFVDFYYRVSEGSSWIKINPDTQIFLPSPSRYIQVKADCRYSGTMRPRLYDFALMVK